MRFASGNTSDNSRRLTAAGRNVRRVRETHHRRAVVVRFTHPTLRRRSADGFSLLEVILALAILSGAIAVLGEVSRSAMEHARYARDLTVAELLCETKMAELTSGITALEAVTDEPCDTTDDTDNVDWLYTIEVEPIDTESGLTAVRVTVVKGVPAEQHPAAFSLTRWIVDSSSATSTESEDTSESSESSESSETTVE